MVEFLIVLAALALVVALVSTPLRRSRAGRAPTAFQQAELAELEAAREAKYRELRDAELDRRTGKLSEADYQAVDRALRAEAIEILRALDRAKGKDEPRDQASPHQGRGATIGP
ncbi:MAG: hypothetical protein JO156_04440 [Solirubrobacterales bacterium]|nr:hypothetical protein [Solirubrobacterales bacterium]